MKRHFSASGPTVLIWVLLYLGGTCFAPADHGFLPHPKILWNVKPYPTPPESEWGVEAVEFSPDGEQIITAGWNGAVHFLNRSNGAVVNTILAHTGAVHGINISRDGLLLASGGQDRMLNIWRISDGMRLRSINAHTSAVSSVAFSPDASLVVSGGGLDNQLKIWRTSDGELVRTIHGSWGLMLSVAFAPNGQYVAGSGPEVWTLDGTLFRSFGSQATLQVKFSPDSARVFATQTYGIVGYALAEGIIFFPWSTSFYPQSAISPDGRSIVSVSGNEMVWAPFPRGGELQSYLCADGECVLGFISLGFDPRLRTLAAGTFSGEVLLFELPIWISGIQRNGNQVDIQWQGGSGSCQLQRFTAPNTWQDFGDPLTNDNASVTIESSAAILRVRNR